MRSFCPSSIISQKKNLRVIFLCIPQRNVGEEKKGKGKKKKKKKRGDPFHIVPTLSRDVGFFFLFFKKIYWYTTTTLGILYPAYTFLPFLS